MMVYTKIIDLHNHYLNQPSEIENNNLSNTNNDDKVPTCQAIKASLYVNSYDELIDRLNTIVVNMNKL